MGTMVFYLIFFYHYFIIIEASLSEPHIDSDNAPSPRGTYLSIYLSRGAFVASMFPRSHAYALTVPHYVILMWRVI